MSDSVKIAQRLYVNTKLDHDGDLGIIVGDTSDPDDTNYTWITRSEILALVTHLGKVLDDEDKKETK